MEAKKAGSLSGSEEMPMRRGLFDPLSTQPYKLSRSKVELFIQCPRCFYLDRRLGISQPSGPQFSLNLAVDLLLKREFDLYRLKGEPHESMVQQGIDAIPLHTPLLEEWRDANRGIRFLHPETNFLVYGAIDDVWVNLRGKLIVVDYKATSRESGLPLTGTWMRSNHRQVEIYQWLLRQNGYDVSDTAYFVYVNADRGRESFDGRLEFTTTILSHTGRDEWVPDALHEIRTCLLRASPPQPHPACEWCEYRKKARNVEEF